MSKTTRILDVKLGDNQFKLMIYDRVFTISYCGVTHRFNHEEKEAITSFLIDSTCHFDTAESEVD